MSLLSTDITKVKRLSLREIKLPTSERRRETYTDEDIHYSSLVDSNPLIELLVDKLQLVNTSTGEPLKKVQLPRKLQGFNAEVKAEVVALLKRHLYKDLLYKKAEIVISLAHYSKVDINRAEEAFNLILETGALEATVDNNYYLTGSTITQINKII
jgi:hypothetical protein